MATPQRSAAPVPDSCQATAERYRLLIEIADMVVSHRTLEGLFGVLTDQLRRVITFDFLSVVLYDPASETMRLRLLVSPHEVQEFQPKDPSMDASASGWVFLNQQPVIVPDLAHAERPYELYEYLQQHGVVSVCFLPLTSSMRRLGTLSLGTMQRHEYSADDIAFLQKVAGLVALSIDNAMNFDAARQFEQELSENNAQLQLLLEIGNALASNLKMEELFRQVSACCRRVMQADFCGLALYDEHTDELWTQWVDFPNGKGFIREQLLFPPESPPVCALRHKRAAFRLAGEDAQQHSLIRAEGLRTVCCFPLIAHDRALGTLHFGSVREDAFDAAEMALLQRVADQVAVALENARAFEEIERLKDRLAEEKLYLEDEIRTQYNFEEIVGESDALRDVLQQVETAAPSDSTVLILGETGTGKELIARALHNLSGRRSRTFVKVNCAAIPTGLLESELFGHEKGAFTGAISQKIGRVELAHGGTLFLDEVGDIPLELQPKLLRVLQEREFERLGSTRTQKVDIRLIAATNRDLSHMVADREFRSDLYYRLNVFPITLPALRDRSDDIPILVRHFVQKYARKMDKRIETIPSAAMTALTRWSWPGNVRELENVIERSVLLTRGSVLQVPLSALKSPVKVSSHQASGSLQAAEREHILRVLKETDGRVGGPEGAAARLGMKRTTLISRMKKHGIDARELS